MFEGHPFWRNFHGTVMSLWIILLISQAYLMKSGKMVEHKKLGKLSFILGPLCVISFPGLASEMIVLEGGEVTQFRAYVLWLQLGLGGLFAWFFAAAIYYRHTPNLHARYMIATSVTLIDPIVARFVIFYGPMAGTPPDPNMIPVALQYFAYPVVLAVLVALLYFDRENKADHNVFKRVTVGFLVFMGLTFTLATSGFWLNLWTG